MPRKHQLVIPTSMMSASCYAALDSPLLQMPRGHPTTRNLTLRKTMFLSIFPSCFCSLSHDILALKLFSSLFLFCCHFFCIKRIFFLLNQLTVSTCVGLVCVKRINYYHLRFVAEIACQTAIFTEICQFMADSI